MYKEHILINVKKGFHVRCLNVTIINSQIDRWQGRTNFVQHLIEIANKNVPEFWNTFAFSILY